MVEYNDIDKLEAYPPSEIRLQVRNKFGVFLLSLNVQFMAEHDVIESVNRALPLLMQKGVTQVEMNSIAGVKFNGTLIENSNKQRQEYFEKTGN